MSEKRAPWVGRHQLALCQILRMLQAPFGWIFWLIEQRIAKIEDFLANEASL